MPSLILRGSTSGAVMHGVAATTASYSMLDPLTAPAAGQVVAYPNGGGQGTWASPLAQPSGVCASGYALTSTVTGQTSCVPVLAPGMESPRTMYYPFWGFGTFWPESISATSTTSSRAQSVTSTSALIAQFNSGNVSGPNLSTWPSGTYAVGLWAAMASAPSTVYFTVKAGSTVIATSPTFTISTGGLALYSVTATASSNYYSTAPTTDYLIISLFASSASTNNITIGYGGANATSVSAPWSGFTSTSGVVAGTASPGFSRAPAMSDHVHLKEGTETPTAHGTVAARSDGTIDPLWLPTSTTESPRTVYYFDSSTDLGADDMGSGTVAASVTSTPTNVFTLTSPVGSPNLWTWTGGTYKIRLQAHMASADASVYATISAGSTVIATTQTVTVATGSTAAYDLVSNAPSDVSTSDAYRLVVKIWASSASTNNLTVALGIPSSYVSVPWAGFSSVIPLAAADPGRPGTSHIPASSDHRHPAPFPTSASGWLHNNGSGTLAWTTPTYAEVGADPAGAAAAITPTSLGISPFSSYGPGSTVQTAGSTGWFDVVTTSTISSSSVARSVLASGSVSVSMAAANLLCYLRLTVDSTQIGVSSTVANGSATNVQMASAIVAGGTLSSGSTHVIHLQISSSSTLGNCVASQNGSNVIALTSN